MGNCLVFILTLIVSSSLFAKAERESLNEKERAEVTKIFQVNERLHKAFFEYEQNKNNIPRIATELSEAISKISNEKVKSLLKFSQSKLLEIKTDAGKDENNQNYHLVSMALIYVLEKFDVGSDYNAYSCPMVKKKWVQNSTKLAKVHNPYAPEMPHCGTQDSKF